MPIGKYVGVILFLLVAIPTNASAADLCYDKADRALVSLKTWNDLRLWYENYPGCDDGYFAEGISDFVVKSFANHWQTLPALQVEIMRNPGFKGFVMNHIDATTGGDDLRMTVSNANTKCPFDLRLLCGEIEKNAGVALKKVEEIEK